MDSITRRKIKVFRKLESIGNLIIPTHVQNANSLLTNSTHSNTYSWEKEGEEILNSDILSLTIDNIRILKLLILKKVPNNLRGKMWVLSSGAKREMKNNPRYYHNILNEFPQDIPSPYEKQIKLDIIRTFPDDKFFDDSKLSKMYNILLAYSRRNISIGYCQGFNFIVGRLLKNVENEEEVFWIFTQIIECILPVNFFSQMAGVMIDSTILNKMIQIYIPDLYQFLKVNNYEFFLTNVTYKWFLSLFSQNISENICFLIWDVLFIDKSIVIFKAAIGIIRTLKDKIMNSHGLEDLSIEEKAENLYDNSYLIYYLILRKFEFDMTYIEKNRNILEKNFSHHKKNNKKNIRNSIYEKNMNCQKEIPLCIYDTYYKHEITNCLILKIFYKPVIYEDYFYMTDDSLSSDVSRDEDRKMNIFKELLIERRLHYCKYKNTKNKLNNSFTALHPFFREIYKSESRKKEKSLNFNCKYSNQIGNGDAN